jgi:predicted metalloenzyme YecM
MKATAEIHNWLKCRRWGIMEYQAAVNMSSVQILYINLRVHHRREWKVSYKGLLKFGNNVSDELVILIMHAIYADLFFSKVCS